VRERMRKMNVIFGGFLQGTILLSVSDGVITCILLLLVSRIWKPFGYEILVAAVAGLLYAVPVVGFTFAAVIAGILGYMAQGSFLYAAVLALVVILGYNLVDRSLNPKIMGEALGVHPVFVMFAALAGAEALGLIGMILGVPIAAFVVSIISYIYKRFLLVEEEPPVED